MNLGHVSLLRAVWWWFAGDRWCSAILHVWFGEHLLDLVPLVLSAECGSVLSDESMLLSDESVLESKALFQNPKSWNPRLLLSSSLLWVCCLDSWFTATNLVVPGITPSSTIVIVDDAVLVHDPIGFDPFRRLPAVKHQHLLNTNLLGVKITGSTRLKKPKWLLYPPFMSSLSSLSREKNKNKTKCKNTSAT